MQKELSRGRVERPKGNTVYLLHTGGEYEVEKHRAFKPVQLDGEDAPRRYTKDVWVVDGRVVLSQDRMEEHFKM